MLFAVGGGRDAAGFLLSHSPHILYMNGYFKNAIRLQYSLVIKKQVL